MLLWAVQAVLQYLFITLAGLNGGHYEVGFWLTLSTAIIAGVLSLGQLLINKQAEHDQAYHHVYLPTRIQTSYAPSAGVQQQPNAPPAASATLVAPIPRGGYGTIA